MADALRYLQDINLGERFWSLLRTIDSADPCFPGLIVLVLVFLGSKLVAGQPALQRWGVRLAAAVCLVYLGQACYRAGTLSTEVLSRAGTRAALVSGAVLALTWTILPILAFVYRYVRVAAVAFLGYGGYRLATEGVQTEQLGIVALQALGVAGLAMIVAWILQPVWDLLGKLVGSPASVRPSQPAPEPVVVEAPLTEEQRAARRRQQVRMKVELSYAVAFPHLGTRFPRSLYDSFVAHYLADRLTPDEVEANGQQFLEVLRQLRTEEAADPSSLEGLTQWYLGELKRLFAANLDLEVRQVHLWRLHQELSSRVDRLLHRFSAERDTSSEVSTRLPRMPDALDSGANLPGLLASPLPDCGHGFPSARSTTFA